MSMLDLDILRLAFHRCGFLPQVDYEGMQVDLDGQKVEIDVEGVSNELLERIAPRVADLRHLDFEARQSLRENLAGTGEFDAMPLYRSHHIDELEPSLARRFFDVDRSDPAADETFLRSMKLVRVGVYTESERIVCDYTIGRDVTNYVVAVAFGADGKVYDVDMES